MRKNLIGMEVIEKETNNTTLIAGVISNKITDIVSKIAIAVSSDEDLEWLNLKEFKSKFIFAK